MHISASMWGFDMTCAQSTALRLQPNPNRHLLRKRHTSRPPSTSMTRCLRQICGGLWHDDDRSILYTYFVRASSRSCIRFYLRALQKVFDGFCSLELCLHPWDFGKKKMVIVSVSWEGAVEKVSVSCHSLAFQNPRSMVTVLSLCPLQIHCWRRFFGPSH